MEEGGDLDVLEVGGAMVWGGRKEVDVSGEISKNLRNKYNDRMLIAIGARKYGNSKPFLPGRCQELSFT